MLGGRLRIGDKLMLSGRNLHELGLMNGTILRLLEHREDDETLAGRGRRRSLIALPEEEAPRLQLAYACSIHKGQGIELPVAIVIAHAAAGAYFLRREMLYTAMTRARTATLIVGQRSVVAGAAATPDTSRRHSRLRRGCRLDLRVLIAQMPGRRAGPGCRDRSRRHVPSARCDGHRRSVASRSRASGGRHQRPLHEGGFGVERRAGGGLIFSRTIDASPNRSRGNVPTRLAGRGRFRGNVPSRFVRLRRRFR